MKKSVIKQEPLFKAREENRALAAELSELRAAVDALVDYLNTHWSKRGDSTDIFNRLRALAAQPQGERGKALLAVVKAVAKLDEIGKKFSSVYSPRFEEFIGAVNEALGAYAALAAIDGAQSDG